MTHPDLEKELDAVDSKESGKHKNLWKLVLAELGRGRWLSIEFIIYIAWILHYFLIVIPQIAQKFEKECLSFGYRCNKRLKPGWLGKHVDLTDTQWRDFRENFSTLLTAAVIYLVVSRAVRHFGTQANSVRPRVIFYVITSITFIVYSHGVYSIFLCFFTLINYVVSKSLAGKPLIAPLCFWVINMAMLFGTDRLHSAMKFYNILGADWKWLDDYSGTYRWNLTWPLTMLRMISFDMDLHWATLEKSNSASEKASVVKNKIK